MKNIDSHTHVSGQSVYLDDIPLIQGTLFGAAYGSPVAHGIITSLQLEEALQEPGVVIAAPMRGRCTERCRRTTRGDVGGVEGGVSEQERREGVTAGRRRRARHRRRGRRDVTVEGERPERHAAKRVPALVKIATELATSFDLMFAQQFGDELGHVELVAAGEEASAAVAGRSAAVIGDADRVEAVDGRLQKLR